MNEHNDFRMANDPNTSREVLDVLSKSPLEHIGGAVALNENASQETLLRLIGNESSHVLENLWKNKTLFTVKNLSVSVCKHIRLRLAEVDDSEFILTLRLDPNLNKHVSTVENNLEKQKEWIIGYKEREKNRKEFYFIIESLQGEQYGAVRLYDFEKGSFCWGSWMIQKDSPSYAAIESALSVYEFAFYTLGFRRSHFDVRKGNDKVIKFHVGFGAKRTSEDLENYYFTFDMADYEVTKNKYEKFFAKKARGHVPHSYIHPA
jgi:hypothetical protein